MKKGLRKIGKLAKRVILAGLLFHAGTQLNYCANEALHDISPSKQRLSFRNEFGFPIEGWSSDIEGKHDLVNRVSEVVRKEKAEGKFPLKSISIESSNYLKKTALQQLCQTLGSGYVGYYFNGNVGLMRDASLETIHHEIKHAKALAIAKEHPEFIEKWRSLALDENGKNLYLSHGEFICSHIRGLASLVDKNIKPDSKLQGLGFVSAYARTNVDEDIAELCSRIEDENEDLWLQIDEPQNKVLRQKIVLAQEYGIIPRDFLEFANLRRMLIDSKIDNSMFSSVYDQKKLEIYMKLSLDFLERNPHSVYAAKIHNDRGYIYECNNGQDRIEIGIYEYKKALNSDFVSSSVIFTAASGLERIYSRKGDKERQEIYARAHAKLYDQELTPQEIISFLKVNGEDPSNN